MPRDEEARELADAKTRARWVSARVVMGTGEEEEMSNVRGMERSTDYVEVEKNDNGVCEHVRRSTTKAANGKMSIWSGRCSFSANEGPELKAN